MGNSIAHDSPAASCSAPDCRLSGCAAAPPAGTAMRQHVGPQGSGAGLEVLAPAPELAAGAGGKRWLGCTCPPPACKARQAPVKPGCSMVQAGSVAHVGAADMPETRTWHAPWARQQYVLQRLQNAPLNASCTSLRLQALGGRTSKLDAQLEAPVGAGDRGNASPGEQPARCSAVGPALSPRSCAEQATHFCVARCASVVGTLVKSSSRIITALWGALSSAARTRPT